MSDEQMHNLYPLIYDKQMARGVEAHTGRRALSALLALGYHVSRFQRFCRFAAMKCHDDISFLQKQQAP
jgi:hypothetical protein